MISKNKIQSVRKITQSENEYVYDIGINDEHPYFFGNNILVHNSCYFTIDKLTETEHFKSKYPDFAISKESVIDIYDSITDEVNDSFPGFMDRSFNTGVKNGGIIKAGRELVGTAGLFIKKKKYAIMVYDKEGKRLDVKGKHGKPKIMGLDMKRSDTPKYMQIFMEDMLIKLLTSDDILLAKAAIFEEIKKFRADFKKMKSIEMGAPKRANGITMYNDKLTAATELRHNISNIDSILEEQSKITKKVKKQPRTKTVVVPSLDTKVNMPGHVRAALNWNTLRLLFNDMSSPMIVDGQKCIVCKLKPNQYKLDSIAYPVDITIIPEWLLQLPYDRTEMEHVIIDNKLENLFSILGWNTKMANYDLDNDDDVFEMT